MKRLFVAALLLVALPAAAAGRVTAAGVTLEPPEGWKLAVLPDSGASLTSPDGAVVWRFFASEPGSDLHAWYDEAWKAVTASRTVSSTIPPSDSPTTSGLKGRVGGATVTDSGGWKHILLLAAVSDGKRVAPMLIEFAGPKDLPRLADLVAPSDSIEMVAGSPAPARPFAAGGWSYPLGPGKAAPLVPPFLGTWAASHAEASGSGRRYQYVFRTDGTYRFHAEALGGSLPPRWYQVVDEQGRWTSHDDKLLVTPSAVTAVVRDADGKLKEKTSPPLEDVTYRFQMVAFEGPDETQLVITPPAPTQRDGAFAGIEAYATSYLLSSTYKPDWKFPP